MDYSKYYTPVKIADILIKLLDIAPPESVIDICCGSHNLLRAAKKQWPNTKLFGVDIIKHSAPDIHCVQCDGRDFALKHINQYPLVVANPPFDTVSKKLEFPDLYNELPVKLHTSRLEIEMLLANLRLLKMGGSLLIIMPTTFVNAKSTCEIRKYIAEKYHVQRIIRLPVEVFGASKISCYALVIKKTCIQRKHTKKFEVTILNSKYMTTKPILIPQKQVKAGIWDIDFIMNNSCVELENRRGNISSSFFTLSGFPILHTAKKQQYWRPTIRYVAEKKSSAVYAEDGDIIVNRIGKAAGQWYVYKGQPIMITDCLYRIKDPSGEIAERLKGNVYSLPLRGVATRYITMGDFYAWYKSLD